MMSRSTPSLSRKTRSMPKAPVMWALDVASSKIAAAPSSEGHCDLKDQQRGADDTKRSTRARAALSASSGGTESAMLAQEVLLTTPVTICAPHRLVRSSEQSP
jgi:hypothetical protein